MHIMPGFPYEWVILAILLEWVWRRTSAGADSWVQQTW